MQLQEEEPDGNLASVGFLSLLLPRLGELALLSPLLVPVFWKDQFCVVLFHVIMT